MPVLDLLEGIMVVIPEVKVRLQASAFLKKSRCLLRCNGNVTAVDDFAPEVEGVGFHGSVAGVS